ncbi:hypothetical protein DB31_3263 [Hyalangium minutum]|uniref:Uncharacterized protein n=1 Tax=Hyalangium minutum TaxID=394096 RepID=A0A085WTX0_9BACT|nr:hypothetical protein DB31_3263 [Hyalangium minutum]
MKRAPGQQLHLQQFWWVLLAKAQRRSAALQAPQTLRLQPLQRLAPHQQLPRVSQDQRAKLPPGPAIHGTKLGPWPKGYTGRYQRAHLLLQPLKLLVVLLDSRQVLLLLLGRKIRQIHRGVGTSRGGPRGLADRALHPGQSPLVPVVVPARVLWVRDTIQQVEPHVCSIPWRQWRWRALKPHDRAEQLELVNELARVFVDLLSRRRCPPRLDEPIPCVIPRAPFSSPVDAPVFLHPQEDDVLVNVDAFFSEPSLEHPGEDVVLPVGLSPLLRRLVQHLLLTGQQRRPVPPRDDEHRPRVLRQFLCASPIALGSCCGVRQHRSRPARQHHAPQSQVLLHLLAPVQPALLASAQRYQATGVRTGLLGEHSFRSRLAARLLTCQRCRCTRRQRHCRQKPLSLGQITAHRSESLSHRPQEPRSLPYAFTPRHCTSTTSWKKQSWHMSGSHACCA